MQYQEFLKRSQRVDFSSHPLNFQGHFLFDEPKTTFPPASLQSQYEPHLASKRQRYRTRLIAEISSLRVAGKDHLKRYILHKFRKNCKRNTIRGTFTNAVKFLKFIQRYRHSELETLRRCDIEAFVEFEQDRGMSAATLCTRLVCLYAFIGFLADEGVMSRQLLKRKIHIKQPIKLPKSIEADDEDRILSYRPSEFPRASNSAESIGVSIILQISHGEYTLFSANIFVGQPECGISRGQKFVRCADVI
ncbi:MAG: hypothetical protein OET63_04025 [Desulfobacterales bacterium]|nr:hypothetical protein [Desulfobacterales bacterium]